MDPQTCSVRLVERDALWEIVLTTITQSLPFPWDELKESEDGVFATT